MSRVQQCKLLMEILYSKFCFQVRGKRLSFKRPIKHSQVNWDIKKLYFKKWPKMQIGQIVVEYLTLIF